MDADSEFYGDDETVYSLADRVADLDVTTWWHDRDAMLLPASRNKPSKSSSTGQLHNSCAGMAGARQLSETVDAFLSRLPPATTDRTLSLPWLWIANPYVPPETEPLVDLLTEGGTERLRLLTEFAAETKKNTESPFVANRQISKERQAATEDLRNLAVACNVVCGKWMLFPNPASVNKVWAAVAHATANNELGSVSKVATRGPDGGEHLICVYTKDFRDKEDVARVLNRLRQLELVRAGGKPIFYKSDAWTYLGLYSKNEWKIPASTYSSKEIFEYIKDRGLK